jgi:hypothetical protein
MMEDVNFTVAIGNKGYDIKLSESLRFSREDINSALIDHTPIYAWYCILAEKARMKHESACVELKRAETEFFARYKQSGGDKRVTDKEADAALTLDPSLDKMRQDLMQLKHQENLADIARDTMRHRKDILIAVATNVRSEVDSLSILKERAKEVVKGK